MVAFASFALYTAIGDEPLSPQKVFVSLALFNVLQFPLNMLPNVISSLVEATVALRRLYNFLTSEELDRNAVVRSDPRSHSANGHPFYGKTVPEDSFISQHDLSLEVPGMSFRWTPHPDDEPILRYINFSLRKGSLLAVVGKVGAGKSSLVSAILGEMYRVPCSTSVTPTHSSVDNRIRVYGSIAYVGQLPWIMNATVRENILFGKPFHHKLYQQTIEACALIPDLDMLPSGDCTEIGERGISLSGGQKQRLSLARAVYAQADIYLFDDPLSAVDSLVGRHIFDKVLSSKGMLKDRARLLITHAIQYLPECDEVMMLANGSILEGPKPLASLSALREGSHVWRLINEYLAEHAEDQASIHSSIDQESLEQLANLTGAHSRLSSSMRSHKSGESVSLLASTPKRRTPTLLASSITSDQTKKDNGRIIVKEESAKGSVSWNVYLTYVKSCSIFAAISTILVMVMGQCASAGSNIWLEHWGSTNTDPSRRLDTRLYLGVYGAFGVAYATLVFSAVILVWVSCAIRSSRVLHANLLRSIVRSPMSFFDTTPLGRIVNRFSKDVYTVDEVLPRCFLGFFRTFFSVFTVFVMITVATPLFVVFIFPMGKHVVWKRSVFISSLPKA